MALTKITKSGITNSAVDNNKIEADAVDATKIADNAISEEHLDTTVFTGNTELSSTAADDDVLLIYDASNGTIKKIQKSNVSLSVPTFSSVSPTSLTSGDGTGNYTIVVTGTKFDASATFKLKTSGGTDISMDSVTRNSSTQLTGTVAKNTANLTNANEPFDIVITNGTSLTATAENQINIDAQPVYTTAAGSLGTVTGGSAISTIDVVAADPESAGNVTFDIQSGTIPPGLSTATVNENGVSKFRITGTPTNPDANTTYNFTLRASDVASNTSSRAFSITINRAFTTESFTSSGTFAVPSGVTSISEVLVVGGGGGADGIHAPEPVHGPGTGGGGASGLIYMPEYPVTPSGTITVTIGNGGYVGSPSGTCGQDSSFGSPGDPGFSPTSSVLTAKGGGGGGYAYGNANSRGSGNPGGSGGGAGFSPSASTGGAATQPTQPGNSGAYGFGNAGGPGSGYNTNKGGGGGAGAAGTPGACTGQGGIGRAYTIADGTTPVYYAGGGGGSAQGSGGQGGGADSNPASYTGTPGGGWPGAPTNISGEVGQGAANKGGGGGGVDNSGTTWPSAYNVGNNGGKGVVIVRY
jgi:hypothetical protein